MTHPQNSDELLPCPFCGGKAEILPREEYGKLTGTFMVGCIEEECLGHTFAQDGEMDYAINPEFDSVESAIAAWNTRHRPKVSLSELVKDVENHGLYTGDIIKHVLKVAGVDYVD